MEINRRKFLWGTGLALGAAAVPPVLARSADAAQTDPDQLFRSGLFDRADRGYAQLLRKDPANAHAVAQRGYIALLANRFADATRYLIEAIRLAPDDIASKQRLAECFVRQDLHAHAVPLLRATGRQRDMAFAELYSQLKGKPWQVHGAAGTRIPFSGLEPLPHVEASINGSTPKRYLLDTYATLDLAQDVAEEAGLRAVATVTGMVGNRPVTMNLGLLESFRLGDIELRNLPVQWIDTQRPPLPDGSQPAGVIGTTLFYHLLTTMDYARRTLVLQRKTAVTPPAGADRLPLWLAGDHFPCTLGSLGDYGPHPVTLDTGGLGHGLDTTVELAERAGIPVDYAHPQGNQYPIRPERISLGKAVGYDVLGFAAQLSPGMPGMPGPGQSAQFGFDLIANFTHDFFKPFSITFDYTTMNFLIR